MARKKKSMSADHKAALAEGRRQGAAVSAYLEALETHKPKRGRKRTPESIERQLADIEEKLDSASVTQRVEMMQRRRVLQRELDNFSAAPDISGMEEDFIAIAADYSERRGIEYATWREAGVSADVLRQAGISRTRG